MFRKRMRESLVYPEKLFFVKVDVKACFDNLPQARLIELAEDLCKSPEYSLEKYKELKPGHKFGTYSKACRPLKKHRSIVTAGRHELHAAKSIDVNMTSHHPDAVLLDFHGRGESTTRQRALHLIRQHVQSNVVKIGRKCWRQRRGISQGSILSSLLCNLCYAEFEKRHLSFVSSESLLLRLVDDFLLITADQGEAVRFLRLMFRGASAFGIQASRSKCLTNFDTRVGEFAVPSLKPGSKGFPYCGVLIDEGLNVVKDTTGTSQTGTSVK